jgi:hypothetical protein
MSGKFGIDVVVKGEVKQLEVEAEFQSGFRLRFACIRL